MLRLQCALVAALALAQAAGASQPRARADDPTLRLRARLLREPLFTPEQLLEIQRIAQRELQRELFSPALPFITAAAAPLAPGVWINLGPGGANYEFNDVRYYNVDSGRAQRILVHPSDPSIVYFASAGGGVWKSFDAQAAIDATHGPHWESLTDKSGTLAVGSLALDPHSPDSLLLGAGDPFDLPMPGVFSSADGGATWQGPSILSGCYGPPCTAVSTTSVRDIKINGSNTGAALAATDVGLFRSTQGGVGTSWTLIEMPSSVPHTPEDAWSLAWVGGTTWLLATEESFHGFLWRSTDDGASWSAVTLPAITINNLAVGVGRMTVAAAPGDAASPGSARVYALASSYDQSQQADVLRSDDGGQTWTGKAVNATRAPTNPNADQTDLNVMHDQAWYNQAIAVDPTNHDVLFVGGNFSLVRSKDGGATWDVIANWLPWATATDGTTYDKLGIPYVHADYHELAISYASGAGLLYVGSDGGIFRSADAFTAAPGAPATGPGGIVAPTFEDRLNRGLATHLIYRLAAGSEATSSANLVLGGLQDNGSRMRNAASPTLFDQVTGGDGIGCGLGKAGGSGAFGSLVITTFPAWVSRSINSGATFVDAVTGLPGTIDQSTNFFMQIANDPNDASAQTFLTPVNAAVAADGTDSAQIFRTVNGAAAWSDITGTVNLNPSGTSTTIPKMVLGVFAHPKAANKYVAFSAARVFVSTFTSAWSWSMSPLITPTSVQHFSSTAFDPNDSTGNTIWVTTNAAPGSPHLFRTTNAGTSWTGMAGTGLPDVPAFVVRLDPADATSKTVYVGTEIGIYRSADGGTTWSRFGTGLPAVKVSDIAIAQDGTAIRIATYGRGFWELYPKATVPSGMFGNGDFNRDQLIDGFDLVGEAAQLDTDQTAAGYDATGNLTGATNAIDWADMQALLAKFGGRP